MTVMVTMRVTVTVTVTVLTATVMGDHNVQLGGSFGLRSPPSVTNSSCSGSRDETEQQGMGEELQGHHNMPYRMRVRVG